MKKLLSLFAILLLAATSYAQNKIDGVWTGKLNAGTQTLTIVIHVNHDANGNAATPVTRTVEVVSGDSPVITLSGTGVINLEVGTAYSDAGATWIDTEDGSGSLV